jgi:DNA-binding MurR/RpiR family transcriptional regulator
MVEEIHNRLLRLGLRITSSSDHQMQMMLAATVERGDVVFVSSLSGNNAEVIKAARIAANYGATTVALTVRDTPLVKAVALALTIDITDDGDCLVRHASATPSSSPSTCWPMAQLSEIALTPRKS